MDFSGNEIPLALALVSGILMAVQGSLNTVLSKTLGLLETTFAVHVIGTIGLIVVLATVKLKNNNLGLWLQAPWYAYLGGLIGVGIIYLVAASIPKVGVANATTAIIVGQVLTAVLIDYFGGFGLEKTPCSWQQLLGVVLLAIGARLLLK